MNEQQALLLILGGIALTQGMRYIGLTVGNLLPTSGRMGAFLNAIPLAILTALVAPNIFSDGYISIIGAVATGAAAYVSKNMLAAMISGIIVVVVLRQGFLF